MPVCVFWKRDFYRLFFFVIAQTQDVLFTTSSSLLLSSSLIFHCRHYQISLHGRWIIAFTAVLIDNGDCRCWLFWIFRCPAGYNSFQCLIKDFDLRSIIKILLRKIRQKARYPFGWNAVFWIFIWNALNRRDNDNYEYVIVTSVQNVATN